MKLDLESILWRTRGEHWDYSFVMRPLHPLVENWYDIHIRVFSGISPEATPTNLGGILVNGVEEHPFVATVFKDPTRKDAAARPIAHYLIWFPDVSTDVLRVHGVPRFWGQQVVAALNDPYERTFSSPPPGTHDECIDGIEETFAVAQHITKVEDLQGEPVPLSLDARVVVEKKKPRSTSNLFNRKWKTFLGMAALVLLISILWCAMC